MFIHQTNFQLQYMFGQYYTPFGGFAIEEYLFGEDN